MIPLIVCVVVGAFLGAITAYDSFEAIGLGFGVAVFGAFAGTICALVVGGFVYNDTHWVQTARTPLVSVADGSSVHGQFFLGSGVVGSEPSFTWYQRSGENNFVRRDSTASESTVHYLARDQQPYYTLTEEKVVGGFWQTWGFNTYSAEGERYDFYVPRGSIVQSYRLDNR